MAETVNLDFAIADYPHTAPLLNGEVNIVGVNPNFVRVVPQIAAFRRMVRQVEFDVCELAPTTYIIAKALGAPFTALPIFVMRRFHHAGLLVNPHAGIRQPKDLEGRKVGVRAYSVTTGVWTRAILMNDYDLDSSKVTWVVDDEEHVAALRLPANVVHAPEGRSLASMMADGDLAAAFDGNAGIGRSGSPTGGWQQQEANYPELFENHEELEARWYRRTGIYPMHGTIVVRDSVLEQHPWVARSLFEAFSRAKTTWLEKLGTTPGDPGDRKYRKLMQVVGDDPLPFGMKANIATIEALEDAAFRQQLIPRRMSARELFVDPDDL